VVQFDVLLDGSQFGGDGRGVGVVAAEVLQRFLGVGDAALFDEPAGGFAAEGEAEEEDEGGEELDGDGGAPGFGEAGVVVPVGEAVAAPFVPLDLFAYREREDGLHGSGQRSVFCLARERGEYQKAALRPETIPIWFITTKLPLWPAGAISLKYKGTALLIIAFPTPEMILPIIIIAKAVLPPAPVCTAAPTHVMTVPMKAVHRRPIRSERKPERKT
jgi:hypothetical protein